MNKWVVAEIRERRRLTESFPEVIVKIWLRIKTFLFFWKNEIFEVIHSERHRKLTRGIVKGCVLRKLRLLNFFFLSSFFSFFLFLRFFRLISSPFFFFLLLFPSSFLSFSYFFLIKKNFLRVFYFRLYRNYPTEYCF